MKNNKNLGMYIGVALVVGAVGFIAYNKLSTSKLQVGNTSVSTDEPIKPEVATNTKLFSSNNPVFVNQLNIKTPQIATDLLNAFK